MSYNIQIELGGSPASQRIAEFCANSGLTLRYPPHVTVKTDSGMGDRRQWHPRVGQVVRTTDPFEVQIGQAAVLADRVVCMLVFPSPALQLLHKRLLGVTNATDGDQRVAREGDLWVPHITLALFDSPSHTAAERADLADAAQDELAGLGSFPASSVTITCELAGALPLSEPLPEHLAFGCGPVLGSTSQVGDTFYRAL